MKTRKKNQQSKIVRELKKEEMIELFGGMTIIKVVINGEIRWVLI